jgi:type III pantothenate kinase
MQLLIDIGNTMIKWALVEKARPEIGQWLDSGMVAHKDAEQFKDILRDHPISRALLSNVAGKAIRERLESLLQHRVGADPEVEWFASVDALAGVRNAYKNPAQLGCDRFAAMIGARALFPGKALIVACCGTATTVDALSADGLFIGGMILPGLGLMASSLARGTAHLPQVAESSLTFNPFALSTKDAITSGCIAAQTGAIEHAAHLHAQRAGDVLCILSGGAARAIGPHLSVKHQIVDNLVLLGLDAVTMTASS